VFLSGASQGDATPLFVAERYSKLMVPPLATLNALVVNERGAGAFCIHKYVVASGEGDVQALAVKDAEEVAAHPVPITPALKLLLMGVEFTNPIAVRSTGFPVQAVFLSAVRFILQPGVELSLYKTTCAAQPGF
jgi:hypothetical protein